MDGFLMKNVSRQLLHSHAGLIKASRKSIRRQPYSNCLYAIFTSQGLKDVDTITSVCCKGISLAYLYPLVLVLEKSAVLPELVGSGGVVSRQMSLPKKHTLTGYGFQTTNMIWPVFTINTTHYVVLYMSICFGVSVFLDMSKRKLVIYERFLSGPGDSSIIINLYLMADVT